MAARSVVVHGWPIALALLTVALGGCAGSDGPGPNAGNGDEAGLLDGLEPGERADPAKGLGAILGVVVDPQLAPIAGASVVLRSSNATTSSAADGRFSFDDVAPGVHLLSASAPGYSEVQASVEVLPDAVAEMRLGLDPDLSVQPFNETLPFTGFIELSGSIVTFTTDLVTRDVLNQSFCDCEFEVFLPPEVVAVTIEAVWTDSVPPPEGTTELYWEFHPKNDVTLETIKSAHAASPLHAYLERNASWPEGDDGAFLLRITGDDDWVAYNQEYEAFVTLWHHAQPMDTAWSFVAQNS